MNRTAKTLCAEDIGTRIGVQTESGAFISDVILAISVKDLRANRAFDGPNASDLGAANSPTPVLVMFEHVHPPRPTRADVMWSPAFVIHPDTEITWEPLPDRDTNG